MCFKNLSVFIYLFIYLLIYLFIYLFIVVIICWDLNIVIMEYSAIVQSFTYLGLCCSCRRLIAMDTFLFVNRLYK